MMNAYNLFDRNGDGTNCSQVINIPDSTSLNKVTLHCGKYGVEGVEEKKEAFNLFDRNGDGTGPSVHR
jgi:Ca2+-binding EF-hand superfamily protein